MRDCLVFDLDDTLFFEQQYVLSGFRAVDHYLCGNRQLSGFFDIASALYQSGERGTIFNQYLEAKGLKHDKNFIFNLVNVYRSHEPQLTLFADAAWALSHFSKSHRLGLITDGYYITQKNKIKALGLADRFEAIVITDEWGSEYWKPHHRSYLVAQEKFGTAGADCIYVGDNPKKDFVTAKKMGWLTIQVNRKGGEYEQVAVDKEFQADFEIQSLYGLENLLNEQGLRCNGSSGIC